MFSATTICPITWFIAERALLVVTEASGVAATRAHTAVIDSWLNTSKKLDPLSDLVQGREAFMRKDISEFFKVLPRKMGGGLEFKCT